MGMAILYNGELTDFRVRTFYGACTKKKQDYILGTLQNTIKRYGISAITVKTPKPAHCSRSIQDLVMAINTLTKQLGIQLTICTISVLTEPYSGIGRANKQILVEDIIQRYPQHRRLSRLGTKDRSNHSAYYVKLFEAIACAELAQRTR